MLHRATALAFVALVTGVLLTPPGVSAVAKIETCQGRPATIVGAGPAVAGTPGDDVIVSGTSTIISADAGDDLICLTYQSSPFPFEVDAGEGDDVVDASLPGAQVNDAVAVFASLGSGRDRYVGVAAMDFVNADGLDDDISTGSHYDDVVVNGVSASTGVRGIYDAGTDSGEFTLRADAFDIELDLDGLIVLNGATAAEITGFDDVTLNAHRAVIVGNSDRNQLSASGCDLRISGKASHDRIYVTHPSGSDDSKPRCEPHQRRTSLSGGVGNDLIFGWSGPDRIEGNGGADRILGFRGNDSLKGNDGRDVLIGFSGADTLVGGRGRDTADGNTGRDTCTAETERNCDL